MNLKINMPKIDLNPHDWNEVCHVLRNHVPEYPVWAFGSRVKWTAKTYSDLDLAIITQQPLSLTKMANIKEALDESNLSIRIDIVDWATTSEAFRKIIERDKLVVQAGRESNARNNFEWKSYRLGETGKIVTGKTPSTNTSENQGNDFPFITPVDFVGNKWITKTVRAISKIGEESVKNCLIPKKAVLVTCIGSDMGKTALSTMQCVTNQQINSIVVNTHKFLPEFIYYNLSLRQQEIKSMAGGSAVPILKKSAFSDMWIECPNLKTQEEIVATLSALDDRIALLRETNTTLEAIAQALFKSWFVDFDPVHAKQEGREPEGMDSVTAALFPDGFEESELGLLPRGWNINRVEEVTEKVGMGPFGSNIKVSTFVEQGIPVVSGQHLRHTLMEDLSFNFITEEHAAKLKNSCVSAGDVVFTHAGNIGQVSLIHNDARFDKYVLSQRQFFLRCNEEKMLPEWITYFFRSPQGQHLLLANASQVGVPSIARPVSYLRSIDLVVPPITLLLRFTEIVDSLHRQVIANRARIQTLATLRDTLLPRLISGQLRLPEDEAIVKEIH